jgi:hypothetical protein
MFSLQAKTFDEQKIRYLEDLFLSFLDSCSNLSEDTFQSSINRFSITIFESIFVATCQRAYTSNNLVKGTIVFESVTTLKSDQRFLAAAERTTTSKTNVSTRLERAHEIIKVE